MIKYDKDGRKYSVGSIEYCEFCELTWAENEKIKIQECKECGKPMLIIKEHRNFTDLEKWLIVNFFVPRKFIDKRKANWTMDEPKRNPDHGYVHMIKATI